MIPSVIGNSYVYSARHLYGGNIYIYVNFYNLFIPSYIFLKSVSNRLFHTLSLTIITMSSLQWYDIAITASFLCYYILEY